LIFIHLMDENQPMYRRFVIPSLLRALADTPAVLLVGPRQSGKTTLVRALSEKEHPARYLTLDDPTTLAAASGDPEGFLAGLAGTVAIDEVQKAPGLLPSIKAAIDRDRTPGRFVLTGSANVLALPQVSQELVGRLEVHTLWPLSQDELAGEPADFAAAALEPALRFSLGSSDDTIDRALAGGFPEALARSPARRLDWQRAYLQTLLARDVQDLAQIEGLKNLPNLVEILAHRVGSPINYAEISRTSGIAQTTLKRYLALLEHVFLVWPLPAWAKNPNKRLAKTARLGFTDTGVLARTANWTRQRVDQERRWYGPLLENFVTTELLKQSAWSRTPARLYHFRTSAGHEVDVVLEYEDGGLVGIEVKAGATLGRDDLRGLAALREAAGSRFRRGIVLYNGREAVPFAADMLALPVSALWRARAESSSLPSGER
jgi:predicted AAA+ superfamily ATPase